MPKIPTITPPNRLCRRPLVAGIITLLAFASTFRRLEAEQSKPLRIGGTGMALATMRQIGQALTATYPAATVRVLPSLGTGGGLAAVAAGAIDLAVSARAL